MLRNLLLLPLMCLAFAAQSQYSETFSVPNKGYLLNLADDFSGVNWSLSAWTTGGGERDATDYFNTTALGVLECIDLDQEVCWESPLLNTLGISPLSVHVDLKWFGFDTDVMANDCSTDYIKVLYRVNSGSYVMIPNVAGGNACATIAYPFENPGMAYDGSFSINQGGIVGDSTLKIRVCVKTNANAELVTLDNVSVPEAGVTVVTGGVGVTDVSKESGIQLFPNPAAESVQITAAEMASGMIRVFSATGQIMAEMPMAQEHLYINVANWPSGLYFVQRSDSHRIWAVERFLVHRK